VTYLLDTNACVMYLNGRAPRLRGRLDQCRPDEIVVCSCVKAELFYGAMKSNNPAATLQKQKDFLLPYLSLPFDDTATAAYATIRADLERIGTPIGGNDLMIAAIAMTAGLTVVTHNCREFGRVAGLQVEDWEAGP
jgi:tRNA(fMet)-specific endonuclease VapC